MQTDGAHDSAKALLDLLLRQASELDDFLTDIQGVTSTEEFAQLRAIVGKIMGSIVLDAMNPIVTKYPDLRPPQMKG